MLVSPPSKTKRRREEESRTKRLLQFNGRSVIVKQTIATMESMTFHVKPHIQSSRAGIQL